MPRDIVEPTLTDTGESEHPAWGYIGASRVSSSPPGAVLFDSDIRHQHYVVVTLSSAVRERKLLRDWLRPRKQIIEVAMSEAQWASFVSSMNSQGVPCTIQWTQGDGHVPGMEYEPRLQESMDEVRNAAERAAQTVRKAFDAYADHKTKGNLDSLRFAIQNMPANIKFAGDSLNEHAENVVQKARADIEAMVVHKAQQLGIEAGDLGLAPRQLGTGWQESMDGGQQS